jgi:hypothetical protein
MAIHAAAIIDIKQTKHFEQLPAKKARTMRGCIHQYIYGIFHGEQDPPPLHPQGKIGKSANL